ncbi:hypothetical protein NKH77_12530 [Streptomyces sp. M19]
MHTYDHGPDPLQPSNSGNAPGTGRVDHARAPAAHLAHPDLRRAVRGVPQVVPALPGDRMGEENLGFVAFSALGPGPSEQPGQHRGS